MSQNRDVNFDPDDGAQPLDVARILAGLDPEPLRIERDELFFQAGIAAASHAHSSVRLWQLTAAALALLCVGLSAVAFHRDGSPQTIAMTKPEFTTTSTNVATTARPLEPPSTDLRTRKWQQLASADFLPPGRLTALGWSELSSEELAARSRASAESPQEPDASPTSSRLTPELLKSLHLPHEG